MKRPIAMSCGDPAGIGPEIAALAWDRLRADVPFLWIGDPRHLPPDVPWVAVEQPAAALTVSATALPVSPLPFAAEAVPGQLDPRNAPGVIAAIERAVALARSGEVSGVCTAPIHKKALIDGAGFAYPGHTEFLAALCGVEDVVMMLASDDLCVVPATIHVPLSAVPRALTRHRLEQVIRITHAGMRRWFAIPDPRIAVAGLNPHAGEGGAIGDEEIRMIAPLLDTLRAQGLRLSGPLSADTMFHARARAGYDVAIAMYHDQALIPIKTLAFDEGVNLTLGLPFLRASPDHGTALDIAGTGAARPDSLIAALSLLRRLALRLDSD